MPLDPVIRETSKKHHIRKVETMNTELKSLSKFAAVAAFAFIASVAAGALVMNTINPALHSDEHHEGAHASWISTAQSVGQLSQEADLIVRVQAIDNGEPRFLWSPTPEGAFRRAGRSTLAFTDTTVEVLEVYSGKAQVGDRVAIMQTGGDLLTRSGKLARLELSEDPIYAPGAEMVLFLVDISNDPVHAQGEPLFRAVNPNGRFEVEGGLVSRISLGDANKARQELDLGTLEDSIRAAVR